MKILVTDLREEGGLELKGSLDPAPYELNCGQGDEWLGIDYDLRLERLGQECLVSGTLQARLRLTCARCAEPLPFLIPVPEFQHTLEIGTQDSIDLTPLIREDILLDFPIAASCQLEAGNKCPYTGHVHKEDDGRFAEIRRDDVWGALEN
ncbi:MAG: DUF177 domain-containing protein [Blastochloris sp.]|nr:DUF177 domain-containing protein [Blastochloris sp.]